MYIITAEKIVPIHDRIIQDIGGRHGLREPTMLIAITEKPLASFGGKEFYPTLFDKSAAVFEAICNYHVFVDGNKRTAITSLEYMLFRNGYALKASQNEKETFTLQAASSKPNLADIAVWIKKHSQKNS